MCEECGCDQHDHGHPHTHDDGTVHSHHHSHHHHDSDHQPDQDGDHHECEHRTINLERSVLAKNEAIAAENRHWLRERGIITINMISSPGSGKTLLLEKTLEKLDGRVPCAVITGDQQTDNDAKRLREKNEHVMQILTGNSCHLNAEQIAAALPEVVTNDTKLLFIENVGNLVCPAAFDLGENFKIALLSTTEGEDKAEKYPVLFSSVNVVVLTKTDLIPHLDWNLNNCRHSVRYVNPGVFIFELSAKTGEGIEKWIDYLESLVK